MNIEQTLRGFLTTDIGWRGSPLELTRDYPLIESGVLDSQALFELVSIIEDHFRIEIADEELLPENFETLEAMTRLVQSKSPST